MAGGGASMAGKIACMVIVCMVMAAPHVRMVGGAITCGQVVNDVLPCLGYLKTGKWLGPRCCAGVQKLNREASATPDRRTACGCLKNAAASFGLSYAYASAVPGACGVNLGFKITPSIDCNTIQ